MTWYFLLPVTLWIPIFKVAEVETHQMLPPTNTTIVLSGWRQSTAVKWCVKTVRFGSQIQFITRSSRQVLFLRISAGNRSAKDGFLRGDFHPFQVPCMPGERADLRHLHLEMTLYFRWVAVSNDDKPWGPKWQSKMRVRVCVCMQSFTYGLERYTSGR